MFHYAQTETDRQAKQRKQTGTPELRTTGIVHRAVLFLSARDLGGQARLGKPTFRRAKHSLPLQPPPTAGPEAKRHPDVFDHVHLVSGLYKADLWSVCGQ